MTATKLGQQQQTDMSLKRKLIYDPCNFSYTEPVLDLESKKYGASRFKVNDFSIVFRIAKTTPKKLGQFVTLWKRHDNKPIQPFDLSDTFDFVVVCARNDSHFGQFVFSKSVLLEKGILSVNEEGGKLAFRIYPPWDSPLNKQALKSQKWQIEYFLNAPLDRGIDLLRAQKLYS